MKCDEQAIPAPEPEPDDAECVHCGAMHASFGILPLCKKCTRKHYRAIPRKESQP